MVPVLPSRSFDKTYCPATVHARYLAISFDKQSARIQCILDIPRYRLANIVPGYSAFSISRDIFFPKNSEKTTCSSPVRALCRVCVRSS